MKLYEIKQEYEDALERAIDPETGEIDEEVMAEVARIEEDLYEKVDNIGALIKNQKAEAEALKTEAKKLTARAKTADNTVERLKNLLANCLDGKSYKTTRVAVSFRRSRAVEVSDVYSLPEEYLRYKDPEPDKTKLREALEAGEIIDGARIVENVSTIIK